MSNLLDISQRSHETQKLITSRFEKKYPGLLTDFPITQYIDWLDTSSQLKSYCDFPQQVLEQFERLKSHGVNALAEYHRICLATLIALCNQRIKNHPIPESIESRLAVAYSKIHLKILTALDVSFLPDKDLFCKDLALCRLKLLPCEAELVDVCSGIPRSLAFKSVSQALRFSLVLYRARGARIWYESHWDRRLLKKFNSDYYEQHYLLVAQLLELNPEIRGLFGASWWYDPQLEDISPELSFLRSLPMANGASLFVMGEDEDATRDATLYSAQRLEMYKTGEYQPQMYFLVWPREALLEWATNTTTQIKH